MGRKAWLDRKAVSRAETKHTKLGHCGKSGSQNDKTAKRREDEKTGRRTDGKTVRREHQDTGNPMTTSMQTGRCVHVHRRSRRRTKLDPSARCEFERKDYRLGHGWAG